MKILRKPIRYSFYHITIWLIGINIFIYILTYTNLALFRLLMLFPRETILKGYFWQPFTYMFLHDPRNLSHILFNMFALYVFGYPLEKRLGSMEFLLLYLFTGLATGLLSLLLGMNVVGASGAIYGLILGYATFFPDSTLLLGFFIPIKAKYALILFIGISLVLQFTGSSPTVAHLAHLGGIVFAFIYFIVRLGLNPIQRIFGRD